MQVTAVNNLVSYEACFIEVKPDIMIIMETHSKVSYKCVI